MISITDDALTRLDAFLKENKIIRHIRVFLPSSGCGGEGQLSLTVDDPSEKDFSTTIGEITFSIDKELQEVTGDVKIDFKDDGRDSGFVVDSAKILPAMDSGCGGCCGCD
ncbi:MAG: IscA/HesB family protein [Deltaproteobacteria bacterium]|jgi:Fe-S cluster assembly iron-binding protein IscA|nr:IscA/HesB family protein [Deltaproteobacteria bacterium]